MPVLAQPLAPWMNAIVLDLVRDRVALLEARVDPFDRNGLHLVVRSPERVMPVLARRLQTRPIPTGAFVRVHRPGERFGNIFQDLFSPNDGAGVAASIERQRRIDTTIANARGQADLDRVKKEQEKRTELLKARREGERARSKVRLEDQTAAIQERIAARAARSKLRNEGAQTLRTDSLSTTLGGQEARRKLRGESIQRQKTDWLTTLLGGRETRQKLRGESTQRRQTGWLTTLLGGQLQRKQVRADADVARSRIGRRRRIDLAKAGQGWEDSPLTTPTEPPTESTPESTFGGMTMFEPDDLFGADVDDLDLFGADLNVDELFGADLDIDELFGADLDADELFGADLDADELFGADDEFDPKALVLRTIEKTKEGTLPDPGTWTRGLSGSALTLGEKLSSWVVKHVVKPVQKGTWESVVLASAAVAKSEIEPALQSASDADRAKVSQAIERVLA